MTNDHEAAKRMKYPDLAYAAIQVCDEITRKSHSEGYDDDLWLLIYDVAEAARDGTFPKDRDGKPVWEIMP